MNFLAHFYLSLPTPASLAGNFLGDFITGTPESLQNKLPKDLLDGIILHRQIDAYTDQHPSFSQAKAYLSPERRRFAGVILDMFTDHFLARHWASLHPTPLTTFQQHVHDALLEYWEFFPERAQRNAQWMHEGSWFNRYLTVEGIQQSLDGLSTLNPKFTPLLEATCHLKSHYQELESLSLTLLSDCHTHFSTPPSSSQTL